jgi:hypothetical protein
VDGMLVKQSGDSARTSKINATLTERRYNHKRPIP